MVLCAALASGARAQRDWSVELSAEEQAWIREHPVVRVAQVADSGPFSFVDEQGHLAGMDLDYLEVIAGVTGLRFESVAQPSLTHAFDALQRRELDAVMAIGKQPAREAFMRYTRAFEYSPDAIVTRQDAPFLFDVRALDGRRIGLAASSTALLATLSAQAPDSEVTTYPSMAEAVRAVSRGEVFAAITDASTAAFTVKREHLTNLRVGGVFTTGDVYVGVRPDYEPLVSIFDKVFAALPPAERARIANRWMVLDYESDRRWERATRGLLLVLGVSAVIAVAAFFSSRRRARELVERRRMQHELEVARDALEEANRGKSGLMRMMAHDLRNPLAAATMCVETLRFVGGEPCAREEILSELEASLRRLKSLIDALVDVQAIEEGKRRYKREPVALTSVLRAAVADFQESAMRKRQRLRLEGPELPVVDSDGAALRQAADNLISNALKYSPQGAEVLVTLDADDAWVRFTVRDQGPGLSAEERSRLFSKYGRGTAAPTDGELATGLGLWIVQQISTGLGGQVRCESEPGHGARFIFEVPRAR